MSARFLLAAMVQQPDHYAVLGVSPDASDAEIKHAFRRLALRLHPDVAEGPESEVFHEIVAAYRALSHPRRRLIHDRVGHAGRHRQAARPVSGVPPLELRLEWFEAERGASKPVEFEESVACDGCGGRGFEHGVLPGLCGACRGSGRLSAVTESETFRYLEFTTCSACDGRGRAPVLPCPKCSGTGGRMERRSIRIRTPPGTRDRDQLAVEGTDRRFLVLVGRRPNDSRLVLAAAFVALLAGVATLLYLLL